MSLSASTLSAIQQAGQGLHEAHHAVTQAVQATAEQMVATVASQPFSPESDRAYAQLRSVARLAHELQAMEEQMKALYTSAAQMVTPEMPVLIALPGHARRSLSRPVETKEGAEDAVVKTAPSLKAKPKVAKSDKAPRLSSNDEKVMHFLKTALDRRSWKSLTHATIAQGAGIPLGSVGLALRRVALAGRVREGSKGAYRLP